VAATTGFRFGFSGSPFASAGEIADSALQAEQAGFDVFVLADLPGAISPLVALAAAAGATTRIRLGTFVLNTGLWSAASAVRELASLDRLSGGRVEIGLGTGLPLPAVQAVMPPTPAARFERLAETVDMIAATLDEPGFTPGFVGRPRLLVAGGGDRTLRLAAERADGFIIGYVPPLPDVQLPPGHIVLPEVTATERLLDRVREYAGARSSSLEFGTGVSVVVTDAAEAPPASSRGFTPTSRRSRSAPRPRHWSAPPRRSPPRSSTAANGWG